MMRYTKRLSVIGLLIGTELLSAQQPGALGPPAGVPAPPALQSAPALGPPPTPALGPPPSAVIPAAAQGEPALGPPPTAIGPAPAPPPYAPPPGVYGQPFPMPPGGYGYAPMAVPFVPPNPTNPMIWGGVEALVWWTKAQPLPVPLITTGPAAAGAAAGNIGVPGTVSLNAPLDLGATGGVRFFGGVWFDGNHTFGMDGSVFLLGHQSTGFGASDRTGTGGIVINEPVIGAPFITQASAPGIDTGGISVNANSRFVGADVDFLYNLYRAGGWTVNLVAGYRYLELDESIDIYANSLMFMATTYTDNAGNTVTVPAGSTYAVGDRFATRNYFNGGQLGASVQYALDRWYFGGAFKMAFGDTHEIVNVEGSTTIYPTNAAPVSLVGGNYATLQIGRYSQDRFAVAPDLELNVGYQVTPWLRATVGYQFLYLSSVLRPGNQIDNTYNGVTHPTVPMVTSGYWAQGLNLGLQFSY